MVTKPTPKSHSKLRTHHAKPYRKRHLSALLISVLLGAFMLLQLGILQGVNRPQAGPPAADTRQLSVAHIISSYGFGLAVDTNSYRVTASSIDSRGQTHDVTAGDLASERDLISASVRPRSGTAQTPEAAARLSVSVNPDSQALANAVADSANQGKSSAEVAGQLFAPSTDDKFTSKVLSSEKTKLADTDVYKTVYQLTPRFAGGTTYAVVWSGVLQNRAFAVTVDGLVGSANIPASLQPVLASLSLGGIQQVKGANISILPQKVSADTAKLDPRYLSDAVSPAVVKIYHLVCGALTIDNEAITNDACSGFTGSGFLVTSDGYIATNGHVVVYGAQDALVDILTGNPGALTAFLRGMGLTPQQIQQVNNDPITLASIIAKIYDIPDSKLHFENKKDLVLVATGTSPPQLNQLTTDNIFQRFAHDGATLKIASIKGYNYAAKDKLAAVANPGKGFSASDVALLKIDVEHAPTLALSHSKVIQNQKVLLIGFPGDADNVLTDNSELSVTVTDGVISSIRQAAGKSGLLYQSDADASHGNSGGPAIDETGQVIGLLTYRASGDASGNAAKSYIRDINDFKDLAAKLHVSLDSSSATQRDWQQGLDLYAHNHYSAALVDFKKVDDAYPSHRLVDNYSLSAQKAIDAGKDVKQLPVMWFIAGLIVAFAMSAISVWLIVRHHGHHQIYKLFHEDVAAESKDTSSTTNVAHQVH